MKICEQFIKILVDHSEQEERTASEKPQKRLVTTLTVWPLARIGKTTTCENSSTLRPTPIYNTTTGKPEKQRDPFQLLI